MHLSLSLSLCSGCSSAANGAADDLLAGPCRASERGFRAVWRPSLCACVFVSASLGRRGASRSRTQQAKCAGRSEIPSISDRYTSARGRRPIVRDRPAPPIVVLNLGCPPYNPWRISEEAPSRVPSRAGSVGPKRRGPFPNQGSRRSLFHHLGQAGPDFFPGNKPASAGRPGENLRVLRCRGLFERHVPLVPIGVVAFEEAPSRAPTRAGYSGRRGPDLGPRHSPILDRPCFAQENPAKAVEGTLGDRGHDRPFNPTNWPLHDDSRITSTKETR